MTSIGHDYRKTKFEDGYEMELSAVNPDSVRALIEANRGQSVVLPPGEYDLNPENLPDESFRHDIIVLEDGTAVFRTMPRGTENLVATINYTKGEVSARNSGAVERLPDDGRISLIAYNKPGTGVITFFEIIFHRESVFPKPSE